MHVGLAHPMMLPLSRAITDPGAGGGGGVFTPDALFFAGRNGFAYDFIDPSLLFQLSNGTTAVTADSDPIGYVTDLSGNGNHGTQATAGNRPLYKSADPRALFNGSNSFLSAGTIDFSATDKVTVIAAVDINAVANGALCGLGAGAAGDFACAFYTAAGNVWCGRVYGSTGDSSVQRASNEAKPVPPFTRVMSFVLDLAGAAATDEVKLRSNGDLVDTSTFIAGPAGAGNFANRTVTIGAWQGLFLNGAVRRLIVIGGALAIDELFDAESWCGHAAGVPIIPEIPAAGDALVNHFPTYGQSLSIGAQARPAISTVANSHYMFTGVGGVRAQESSAPYTALVNHFESDSAVELLGETPCYGAYELLEERGYSGQFLASAPGQGSETIANLYTGGYFTRFMENVTNGRKLSRALGKSFKLRAFMWMQGEGDGANASYAADMATLQGNVNTSVKAITKQTDDVWCLTYQLARAKIGLAHLAASDTYSHIRVAMPMYFLPTTDGVHLTAASSKIAGAYFGLAYKAIILDGNTSWQPLKCTGSSVAAQTIDLTYNRSGLAFDTTTVAAQTNQGFRVLNASDTPLTVSSVTIVGGNTVRIVVASGTPAKVYYGFSDPADHTADIAKGNLRDSQGSTIVFDGGGLNYPMHNWAVLQSITL